MLSPKQQKITNRKKSQNKPYTKFTDVVVVAVAVFHNDKSFKNARHKKYHNIQTNCECSTEVFSLILN